MFDLDFDNIRIVESKVPGCGGYLQVTSPDFGPGVMLMWENTGLVLFSLAWCDMAGEYGGGRMMTFPSRPFPTDKAQAVGIVKNVLAQFAAALVAAYPGPRPCPACNYCGGMILDCRCSMCGEAG